MSHETTGSNLATTALRCPACQAPYHEGDRFCERCGTVLADGDLDPGGRIVVDLSTAAAVSDRGLVHHRNEDAFHLELGPDGSVAAIVCDGTSTASAGNAAAREAAAAAGAVLSKALVDPGREPAQVITEAIGAAREAVESVPWTSRTMRVDPSCTIVSALYREGEITVGSVGDSRAYWIVSHMPEQVTVDDSLAAEGLAKGLLTPEQAANSPFLHSITHWVGPNSPDDPPHLNRFRPDRAGRLLLCTDGLWNYAASTSEFAELLSAVAPDASTSMLAHALADSALAAGGHDNVTVVVVDVDGGGAEVGAWQRAPVPDR